MEILPSSIRERTVKKMSWNILCFLLNFLSAKSKFRMKFPRSSLLCFLFTFIIVFQFTSKAFALAACTGNVQCFNGYCDSITEKCVCFDGWAGDNCEHCNGRTRLTAPSGYIQESTGAYSPAQQCTWLIDSKGNNTPIHLQLESFGTECSWDHLFIYDGDSIHSPLVAALSGPIIHESEEILHQFSLSSGFAYLYFYSDAAYTLDGFNISYSIGDCAGRNCSGNGFCDPKTFQCQCHEGWTGDDCTIPQCPDDCGSYGSCVGNQCICQEGYYGRDCGTAVSNGLWEIHSQPTIFTRTSSASVLIGDELWVIGGYTFEQEKFMSVYKYSFISGISEQVPVTSPSGDMPAPRYGHSAALYEDIILVYGGNLVDGPVTSELWALNTTSLTWENRYNNESEARLLEGHTAHIANDTMLVFFGYNPKIGYVSWVMEYDILNNTWSRLDVSGFPVLGSYGHTSVYSEERRRVYVYAGYPFTRLPMTTRDPFYEFDVDNRKWTILPSPGQPRYLHSAVLHNDKMYVFGGNSHTDNNQYEGAQCYSNRFMVFDFDCNQWHEEELSSGLKVEIARFGHIGVEYGDIMWYFGGFNGVVLDNVVTYTPVNCSLPVNETTCELAGPGPTCMWDITQSQCTRLTVNETVPHNVSFMECDSAETLANCSASSSCNECIQQRGCGWCDDQCSSSCTNETSRYTCSENNCGYLLSCQECNDQENCKWDKKCQENTDGGERLKLCAVPCSSMDGCDSCTSTAGCMWCQSQRQCIDSSTYMTSFPYGTCLAWYTGSCGKVECSQYETCDRCQRDPSCGWCDHGNSTGLGSCISGSYAGPLNGTAVDLAQCPADRWYFADCPSCQCNGHSICLDGENCTSCQDNTEGDQCDICMPGYYGNPLNGGNCSACECNGHSETCIQNSAESECFCDTKGIIGNTCDKCDEVRSYYGDPTVNSCYYRLYMNFKYTFQLDDTSGENLTKINMFVRPEEINKDIDFTLSVDEPISFRVTYTTSSVENEKVIIDNQYVEDKFEERFSRYDYDFKQGSNTTFLFYISNFTHPFSFRIYVEENMLTLIVVTFGSLIGFLSLCALALLVVQKICMCYYNRQFSQQREVEMAEMAARPFASIFVEIDIKGPPPDLIATTKPKKKVVAFAVEPLKENKAALATIVLQLPFPDGVIPVGQSGITLATALVNQGGKTAKKGAEPGHPVAPPAIHEPAPESNTMDSSVPRATDSNDLREATPNGRPNTARDIQLLCEDASTGEGLHGYDNPAMV